MKTTILMFIAMILSITYAEAQPMNKIKGSKISFDKTTMDYGIIKKGSDPLRKFNFKNQGDEALVISNAHGSCGCTVPEYPKQPIAPGETGSIDVRYDTSRLGKFTKTVTVNTLSGENIILTIMGERFHARIIIPS
jgi:hypothetical protein